MTVSGFDWGKLIKGFAGFEDLAVDFVKDKYPHPKWESTKRTRDGNRDAQASTIICGFQPYAGKAEEWWMEAKYSQTMKSMSRYRLDATIVSAIISKNISRIIFVTNIIVSAKTISDIQIALLNSIGCKEVYFCTKYTLEYWLSKHPEVMKQYFEKDYKCPLNENSFVLEDLEFYSDVSNRLAFREPLGRLELGTRYYGYCLVFSNKKNSAIIMSGNNLRGLRIIMEKADLYPGENIIHFLFEIADDYGYSGETEHNAYPEPTFSICTKSGEAIVLRPKKRVIITKRSTPIYSLQSQNKMKKDIGIDLEHFFKDKKPWISMISGQSGVGKSFVIREIINLRQMEYRPTFFAEMSFSTTENEVIIPRIVWFILFPYLSFDDADKEYLDKIRKDGFFGYFIHGAIEHSGNADALHQLIIQAIDEASFFSKTVQVDPRVIIIDDFHKCGSFVAESLFCLIREVINRQIPVYFLISGQHRPDNAYLTPVQGLFPLKNHKLELTSDDMISCINEHFGRSVDFGNFKAIFNNLIEMFNFIRYVGDLGVNISTISDIKTAYASFCDSKISESLILSKFKDIQEISSQAWDLLRNIYWAPYGRKLEYSRELEILFDKNLVRCETDGLTVPYHDTYIQVFRANFPDSRERLHDLENDSIEGIRFTFKRTSALNSEFSCVVRKITELSKNRQFFSVYYALSDLFETENAETLKNRYGKSNYYQLLMAYASSSTNISIHTSGKELFNRIYNETKDETDAVIQKVCVSALWELTNSCYEWLEYDAANSYANELISKTCSLAEYGILKPDIHANVSYHNAHVIKTLIASDMTEDDAEEKYNICCADINRAGFNYRYYAYILRYALTQLARDADAAYKKIKQCRDAFYEKWGATEKYYLWGAMDAAYASMILTSEPMQMTEVRKYQDMLKLNYYNDYRKSLLATSAYYYSRKEVSTGDAIFLRDSYVKRKLRPRQQGFHYEVMALRAAVCGMPEEARDYLQSARTIFYGIPSYLEFVEHNLDLLNRGSFNDERIAYCVNGRMERGVYYVDPRCVW